MRDNSQSAHISRGHRLEALSIALNNLTAAPLRRPAVFALVSSEAAIVRALENGAGDYSVKPLVNGPFMTRLRRVLASPDLVRHAPTS